MKIETEFLAGKLALNELLNSFHAASDKRVAMQSILGSLKRPRSVTHIHPNEIRESNQTSADLRCLEPNDRMDCSSMHIGFAGILKIDSQTVQQHVIGWKNELNTYVRSHSE